MTPRLTACVAGCILLVGTLTSREARGWFADSEAATKLEKAAQLIRDGDLRAAEDMAKSVLASKPKQEEQWNARELLLQAQVESGRFKEAITSAQEFLATLALQRPEQETERLQRSATALLARAYRKLGEYKAATNVLELRLQTTSDLQEVDPLWEIQALHNLADLAGLLANAKAKDRYWHDVVERCLTIEKRMERGEHRRGDYPEVADAHAAALLATRRTDELEDLIARLATREIPATITVLRTWADSYRKANNLPRELECLEQALDLIDGSKPLRGNKEQTLLIESDVLWKLADAHQRSISNSDATKIWQRSISSYAALLDTTDKVRLQIQCLQRIHAAHKALDQNRLAIEAGTQLVDLLARTSHPLDPRMYLVKSSMGTLYFQQDLHVEALREWDPSFAYWSNRDPTDANAYVTCLLGLVNLHTRSGAVESALTLLRRHERRSKQVLHDDPATLASLLSSQGSLESAHGYFVQAIRCYRDAEQLLVQNPSTHGDNEQLKQLVGIRFDLATIYQAQASHREALSLYEAALQDQLNITQPDDHELIRFYVALATERLHLAPFEADAVVDHLAEARRLCALAQRLVEIHAYQETPIFAKLAQLSGELARVNGDDESARTFWQHAIDVARSTHQTILTARLLNQLAGLEAKARHFDTANTLMEEALEIVKQLAGFPNLRYVTLVNRARVLLLLARDDKQSAIDVRNTRFDHVQLLLESAIAVIEEPRANVRGNATDRAKYFQHFGDAFTLLFELNAWRFHNTENRDALVDAVYFAEAGRNRTFLDQVYSAGLDLHAILGADSDSLIDRRDQRLDEIADIAAMLRAQTVFFDVSPEDNGKANARSEDREALQVRMREKEDELQTIEQQIYQDVEGSSADASTVVFEADHGTWSHQLEQIMRPGVGLLFYHVGQHESHVVALSAHAACYEPLSIPSGDASVGLGIASGPLSRADVSQLTESYLEILQDRRKSGLLASAVTAADSTGEIQSSESAKTVSTSIAIGEDIIPGRIRDFLHNQSIDSLVIVPDATLHRLPFEGLVVRQQETPRFLVDVFPPIAYAPSAMVMARLIANSTESSSSATAALTVGNPLRADVPELPEAATESNAIYNILAGHFGKERTIQLLGAEATEPAVREVLSTTPMRFIHFAAHAEVQHDKSGVLAGGLLLTAKCDSSSDGSDGRLTLSEVQALPLHRCDLAVLSACETNVGLDVPLEAGMTMARAFFAAGARRVVASQWKVSDASTSLLMANLFTELGDTLDNGSPNYATALHKARIEVRKKWPLPYHWASFVLIGPPQ